LSRRILGGNNTWRSENCWHTKEQTEDFGNSDEAAQFHRNELPDPKLAH
jgi:hypothetical protein